VTEKKSNTGSPDPFFSAADAARLFHLAGVNIGMFPGDAATGEPFEVRYRRHKERRPHVERALQVAYRAISVARRLARTEPSTPAWADLTSKTDAMYVAAFNLLGWGAERLERMYVVDAIATAAEITEYVETCRTLARQRLGKKLSRAEKSRLRDTTSEAYLAAVKHLDASPGLLDGIAAGSGLSGLALGTPVANIRTRAPRLARGFEAHATVRDAAIVAWVRGRGQWDAVAALVKALGLAVQDPNSIKVDWSLYQTARREKTKALRGR
jgi:hypothetical protein